MQNGNAINVSAQQNALLIAKTLLNANSANVRRERATLFIKDKQIIINLLRLEEAFIENDYNYQSNIELYFAVMAKLCSRM